jgi:hypothetical protein
MSQWRRKDVRNNNLGDLAPQRCKKKYLEVSEGISISGAGFRRDVFLLRFRAYGAGIQMILILYP